MENADSREALITRLKGKLRDVPLGAPSVETIQPEIRSVSQYAMLPSMRAGFRLDEPEDD